MYAKEIIFVIEKHQEAFDRREDTRDKGRSRQQEYKVNGDYTKLFVNLGSKDGFYKASFLQFILDMSDLRKDVLGKD